MDLSLHGRQLVRNTLHGIVRLSSFLLAVAVLLFNTAIVLVGILIMGIATVHFVPMVNWMKVGGVLLSVLAAAVMFASLFAGEWARGRLFRSRKSNASGEGRKPASERTA